MIWLKNHNRITIDVDKPNFSLCMKRLLYGLRLLRCRFDVYVSSGKKGFHIIFHKVLPYWQIMFYRLIIGDDKKRLWFDFLRLLLNEPQLFDLLFDRYRIKNLRDWKHHYKITDYCYQNVYISHGVSLLAKNSNRKGVKGYEKNM